MFLLKDPGRLRDAVVIQTREGFQNDRNNFVEALVIELALFIVEQELENLFILKTHSFRLAKTLFDRNECHLDVMLIWCRGCFKHSFCGSICWQQ